MKVVLPMAGRGSRLECVDSRRPKPLIEIAGRPMVFWALDSIEEMPCSELTVIALAEHEREFELRDMFRRHYLGKTRFVLLDEVTEGQLCTVVTAQSYIDTDEDILIINSDTYVEADLEKDIQQCGTKCHGLISVAQLPGSQWSIARTDDKGAVVEVAEKKRISSNASTGHYYFRSGSEFLATALDVISKQEKECGEYYVIRVHHKYIERGWNVGISRATRMVDMGNPTALSAAEKVLGKCS
jgi:NDP-sugar pyrophosphorylase family protein